MWKESATVGCRLRGAGLASRYGGAVGEEKCAHLEKIKKGQRGKLWCEKHYLFKSQGVLTTKRWLTRKMVCSLVNSPYSSLLLRPTLTARVYIHGDLPPTSSLSPLKPLTLHYISHQIPQLPCRIFTPDPKPANPPP